MSQVLFLICLLIFSLLLVLKSADIANDHCGKISRNLNLPKYVMGFIIVALVSILPEAFISIEAAFRGESALGVGTLLGSNVADLTMVFALVALISGRDLNVQSKIIKNGLLYVALISLPIIFGFNGSYSRTEGLVLFLAGFVYFVYVLKGSNAPKRKKYRIPALSSLFFLISIALLLVGANFTIKFGIELATVLDINPVYVGMFVIGLGTTIPELLFSIRAAKKKNDSLAMGDILGTVVADSTILIGIMALIHPFKFNPMIARITGISMIAAILILFYFLKSGKKLSRKEAIFLLIFYIFFVWAEVISH